ncbi:MAG: hypothetical protein M3O62_00305 [Pseudomonadota bacterium]|nr:hypothetical protein [Pseudomonadota bacterium]
MAKILPTRFGNAYPFLKSTVLKYIAWAVGPLMGPVARKFTARNVGHPVRLDNQRSLNFGVHCHSVRQTVENHFQQVIDDGLLQR